MGRARLMWLPVRNLLIVAKPGQVGPPSPAGVRLRVLALALDKDPPLLAYIRADDELGVAQIQFFKLFQG